ncbi:MarR family transcriptional regulator [Staphylococcus saprophyticus]|uniref:Transcriptional regulator n=2 Tax=Staphylococcus TaxID=1279 RepID=Q49YY3_STAS1|nr:MarR family transcriptional regulator [Staphylococcus saprophyticus]ASF19926.2 MarR family transcriptional regulator [Staphylococcus saprophyticus]MDW3918168.1 MarR family transcriptional regulator [Staphylococcus saprophyticus]MDW4312695.1 MarR family transcriptional regulator [Staphylococcus saprophyticus]MEB6802066.1 MarR family transcriptional regulator [Staphylococcus saprophyticus]OOC98758.1 MarR family transcriptional regulator [Staphylococcus saprophyticus subsp. saprophyticus ATCC 
MTKKTTFLKAIDQLYETAHLLNQYENIPRKYGTDDELYMVEAHMINLIGVNKVMNISEIAKQMNRTKSAASQKITRLVQKGLVVKNKSTHSSREVSIELTDKGEKVFQYHQALDSNVYNTYLEKLETYDTKDFENIEHFLNMISENLNYLINDTRTH